MIYIESKSHDPYYNLAAEQFVFDRLPRDREYFMLWQNDRAIIVGKFQNTEANIKVFCLFAKFFLDFLASTADAFLADFTDVHKTITSSN